MNTLEQLFGCEMLPYARMGFGRVGMRPAVETAWVMPMDRNAEMPTFGIGTAKTVWERAEDLTYRATT